MTTRNYVAMTASNGTRIMSHKAKSFEEAREEFDRQLSKPGRTQIRDQWKANGAFILEEREVKEVGRGVIVRAASELLDAGLTLHGAIEALMRIYYITYGDAGSCIEEATRNGKE